MLLRQCDAVGMQHGGKAGVGAASVEKAAAAAADACMFAHLVWREKVEAVRISARGVCIWRGNGKIEMHMGRRVLLGFSR